MKEERRAKFTQKANVCSQLGCQVALQRQGLGYSKYDLPTHETVAAVETAYSCIVALTNVVMQRVDENGRQQRRGSAGLPCGNKENAACFSENWNRWRLDQAYTTA